MKNGEREEVKNGEREEKTIKSGKIKVRMGIESTKAIIRERTLKSIDCHRKP